MTFLEADKVTVLEKMALKLWEQGKIVDPRTGPPTRLREKDGENYAPHYAVANYALVQLVNGRVWIVGKPVVAKPVKIVKTVQKRRRRSTNRA